MRFALIFSLPALMLACVTEPAPNPDPEQPSLSLSFVDLPDLGADQVYEGWLIVDGSPVSTGRFSADEGTQGFDFTLDESLRGATTFVLTLEPAVGDDPAPSEVHLLAGEITDGQADLDIAHPAAVVDLSTATGSYILETPSDDDPDNYANGIWFVDSLELPTLPAGWVYEGWVVVDGTPVSTGRFLVPDLADDDGAGAEAGVNPTPPYPGQDFVTPPTSLIGATVVLTVEPEPDNAPGPFVLKPLIDATVEDVGAGTPQAMTFQDTAPVGVVILE